VADLYCPGCGGTLPDCFCRSGLTAGTFANAPVQEPVTFESIRETAEKVKAIADARHISNPIRLVVTPLLPTSEGKHWWHDPLSSVLFISREAKEALLSLSELEMARDIAKLLDLNPRPEL
jgi:hypothetical protein